MILSLSIQVPSEAVIWVMVLGTKYLIRPRRYDRFM